MTSFLKIDEPPRPLAAARGFVLWQLGFRPFYLLASGFAALSIAPWSLQFTGRLAAPCLPTPSAAVHALTVGAIGGLVIGMMTRTARGHTARPLRADGWDVAWSAGFGLYAVCYWKVPTRARLDGKAG